MASTRKPLKGTFITGAACALRTWRKRTLPRRVLTSTVLDSGALAGTGIPTTARTLSFRRTDFSTLRLDGVSTRPGLFTALRSSGSMADIDRSSTMLLRRLSSAHIVAAWARRITQQPLRLSVADLAEACAADAGKV